MENGLPLLPAISDTGFVGDHQSQDPGNGSPDRRARSAGQRHDHRQSIGQKAEGGEKRGYDGGKKITGRKRNLIVDTLGLVIKANVTAANVQDVHAGKQTFQLLLEQPEQLTRLQTIFADGGYRGELVNWVAEILHANLSIILKKEDQQGFQVLPKRWVIERTNAWISRCRRLARDYERRVASSEAFIYIAMIRIGLRRLARKKEF
jgi:putative transposase